MKGRNGLHGSSNSNNHNESMDLDKSAKSKQGARNNNGHNSSSGNNMSSSNNYPRRRSSLGLEENVMGGGAPNPYGYTTESRPARNRNKAKQQQQQQQQNPTNTPAAANSNAGVNQQKIRRPTAGPSAPVKTARGKSGVLGLVRSGSARGFQAMQQQEPLPQKKRQPNDRVAPRNTSGAGGTTSSSGANRGSLLSMGAESEDSSRSHSRSRSHSSGSRSGSDSDSNNSSNSGSNSDSEEDEKDRSFNSLFDEEEASDPEGDSFLLLNEDQQPHGGQQEEDEESMSDASIPLMNVMDQTNEIRQTAADAKKDALVESLVWFSHHTPRTVLEDLVSHEIEIWQAERGVDMTIMEGSCESFEESSLSLEKKDSDHKKQSAPPPKNKRSSTKGGRKSSLLGKAEPKAKKQPYAGYGGMDDDEDDEDASGRHNNDARRSSVLNGDDSSIMDQSEMEESAISELSDEGMEFYDGNFSESILKLQQGQSNTDVMIKLPKMVEREGAVLFADITGFTKLSTMLDCESLSKVINSYFDMIVNEVVSHGGDILKFAGDAFFAEWKINDYHEQGSTENSGKSNPLSSLNMSLSHIQDFSSASGGKNGDEQNIPRLSTCVLAAAKCAAAIVEKFSDFSVGAAMPNAMPIVDGVRQEAILNVHCGIGAGSFVGLHVGDYKEDPDEEGVELRREFLVLGDPIDQVRFRQNECLIFNSFCIA